MHVGFLVWCVHSLSQLELFPGWNSAPPGTPPWMELCPSWNSSTHGTLPDWISLYFRTHLLGIICKNIGSLLFPHHLDENIDLNLDFFIPANPFDVAIEAYDSWNIAMCLHSFKQFECSRIKSMHRLLDALDHLLTEGNGCFRQTIDDRSMVVLSLLEGAVTLSWLELRPLLKMY